MDEASAVTTRFALLATAGLLLAAGPVHGGDWNGPYAGLGGAAPSSSVTGSSYRSPYHGDALGLDADRAGALLSGYSGFGWSRGGLYLGGEAGLDPSFGSRRPAHALDDADPAPRGPLGISGLMGGLVRPDTLLYGRAGYLPSRSGPLVPGFRDGDLLNGLRLGAGAEFRLWDNTRLRLEYNHVWHDNGAGVDDGAVGDNPYSESWFEAGGVLRF
ncbi:outer membrane beta-barrel protein [Aquisalimonas lutea]|uniref:outer membrane protein n=1 Tax=Aquisalimonas lutea TaxID=1327750 RepID=UPI0025B54AF9|nr:outer membrane beta-barrel protein [Aquisalimonas lutea]MDN3516228.1 outer membrane beta-barrel protein [Aquisalimonas lutea]